MAEEKEMCPSCCERKKHRQEAEYQDLLKRLNRIEGQVRGVVSGAYQILCGG